MHVTFVNSFFPCILLPYKSSFMAQGVLCSDQKRLWTTVLEEHFSCKLTSSLHTVCHCWFPETAYYIIDISEEKDFVSYVQNVTVAHVLTLSRARYSFWISLGVLKAIFLACMYKWNISLYFGSVKHISVEIMACGFRKLCLLFI